MGRPVSSTLLKALHVYSFAALVIGGSTCAYYLSISLGSWAIHTGCKPDRSCNTGFFTNFSSLGFCIILFLYAIVEAMSFFQVERVKAFDVGYVKPIIYLISGICLLGLCGDLGIAAGSLMLVAGVLWVALLIFIM